jgi:hypothetical protein
MEKIPVEFNHQGNIVKGFLQAVCGAGASVWHLMVDGFYYGRLRIANDRWVLDTNKRSTGMEMLSEYLGRSVKSNGVCQLIEE